MRVGGLLNDAGTTQSVPIQKASMENWQKGISVNLTSTFLFCKRKMRL